MAESKLEMNTPSNNIPVNELKSRWQRYRNLLAEYLPEVGGAFIFSRLNIYYFTGTFANGLLYLPMGGEPILFCRRGAERAKIETPLTNIIQFNSYRDIEILLQELDVCLPDEIATEMNGLSWALSKSLVKNFSHVNFVSGDTLIALTRSKKSEWELQILRDAGSRHNKCLTELLPPLLHSGITELQISHKISELFFSEGHLGILRMNTFGEEIFLGHIAIGDSANYPSVFNGPVGLIGAHPAAPFMGSDTVQWKPGSLLTIDNGFTLSGYQTDKTHIYWLGSKSSIPDSIQNAHNFCVDIQNMVAEKLRPGAIPSQIWHHCQNIVAKSQWSEGFMGLESNKVNFVGHGIGLAIDEYPVLAERFDLPLEEGMVLAVEPKIGIKKVGMVGIENTFEVTANGGRSLTGNNYDILTV